VSKKPVDAIFSFAQFFLTRFFFLTISIPDTGTEKSIPGLQSLLATD